MKMAVIARMNATDLHGYVRVSARHHVNLVMDIPAAVIIPNFK